MTSWFFVTLLALVGSTVASHKEGMLIDCLQQIQDLNVVLPSDEPAYTNDTSVWELKIPKHFPAVVIIPTTTEQLAAGVKCALAARIRVVPKSGGHSYEGWSVQNDTLAVNLMAMDSVVADKNTGLITAGAGATLGMLYYYSWYDAGMGFNAGTCPPVGVSGFMLGGGFGYYSRRAGMGCDNVVSFRMVTASGKIVKVSKGSNPDIYWAACGGGGGNFGIVTEWTLNMMAVPDVIQYGTVSYSDDVSTAATVANYFQTWASQADEDLGSELHVGPNNSAAKLFFSTLALGRFLRS